MFSLIIFSITVMSTLNSNFNHMLLTSDAHSLYRTVGFTAAASPERYMERVLPDV